ncbi:MAG TPA: ferritin [Candidatus Fermentibacter daniensis]|nr:ferritin [Candidatus Fermentibacter daniensis]
MIGKKLLDEFNAQINEEAFSAYLYLSMSAWFESVNLPGFASWMAAQSREENDHAMKFFSHILERGGKVSLEAIAKPTPEWKTPLEAFEAALAHEKHITGRINGLMDLAIAEKDHASASFLRWFVDEQVEEEASMDAVVQKLLLTKNAPGALFMIDRELAARN